MSKQSEERQEEIQRLVEEQEASGLSVKEFAEKRGISRWSLYEWRRSRRRERRKARVSGSRGFVELKVVGEQSRREAITVELASGVRLQVPAGFEEGHLRRLVEVLRSC